MKCRVCEQELRPWSQDQHCAERMPGMGDICVGCFVASVELEKFLLRARDRTVMGAWAEGALRAVLEDPERFREEASSAAPEAHLG